MLHLERIRLPKRGSWVEVTTEYGVRRGELVGVVPGKPNAQRRRDRWPKLALKGEASACAIPGYELVKVRRIARPKGGAR
jgi:hypothetical protein